MEDEFDLPVTCQGEEHSFRARLRLFGYSYRIEVDVEGVPVLFEPDEERNWRALVDPELHGKKSVRTGLLQCIAASLDAVTK